MCPWRNIAEELELCYRSVTETVIHVVCKNLVLIGKRTLAFLIVVFLGEGDDGLVGHFSLFASHVICWCLLVLAAATSKREKGPRIWVASFRSGGTWERG